MVNCSIHDKEFLDNADAYGEATAEYLHFNVVPKSEQVQYLVDFQGYTPITNGININGVGDLIFTDGKLEIGEEVFLKSKINKDTVEKILKEINNQLRDNGINYVRNKYGFNKLITKPYKTNRIVNFNEIARNTVENRSKVLQATKEESIANFPQPTLDQEKEYRIEQKDEYGNHVGFFSSSLQKEIVDSMFARISQQAFSSGKDIFDDETSSKNIENLLRRTRKEFIAIYEEEVEDLDNTEEASLQAGYVLESWPEFTKLLKEKFKKYKISTGDYDFTTDENIDNPTEDDSTGGDEFKNNYILENLEIDPRDTLGQRVKLFLSFLPDVQVYGEGASRELRAKKNLFGYSKLYEFDKLYSELLYQFANKPNITLKEVIKDLRKQQFSKPIFGVVADNLEAADIQTRKEFITSINKVNIASFLTLLEREENKANFRTFEENRSSFEKVLVDQWKENQKIGTSLIKLNEKKEYYIDGVRVAEYRQKFNTIESLKKAKQNTLSEMNQLANMMLADLGITLTEQAKNELYGGLEFVKTKYKRPFIQQFSFTKEGAADGLFSSLLEDLEGTSKASIQGESDDTTTEYSINRNNPLYFANDNVKTLALVESRHNLAVVTKGHITLEGKQVYDFSNSSYQWREIFKLISSEEERLKMKGDLFGSNAPFFESIFLDDARRAKYKPGMLAGFKNVNSKTGKGKTRGNMTAREQFITSLTQYINGDSEWGNFLDLTKSDKKVSPIHTGVYKYKVEVNRHNKVVPLFNKLVQAELDRIRFVQENKDSIDIAALKEGGKNFYFVHLLNEEFAKPILESYERSSDAIWQDGLLRADVTINTPEVQILIEEFIQSLYKRSKQTFDSLNINKQDILDQFSTTSIESEITELIKEIDFLEKANSRDSRIEDKRVQIVELRKEADYLQGKADKNDSNKLDDTIFEWSINQYLMNTTLSMMYSGDPALFYKKGKTIDETLRKTFAEYGKRQAKDMAPGSAIEHTNSTYSSLVAKVDKSSIDYLKGFDKLGAYKSVDTTDAIQYATVKRYTQLMYDSGKITQEVYDSINKKITDSVTDGTYYYDLTEEEKGILFGPTKPVEVSRQPLSKLINGKTYSYINYVKSALFPLVPNNTQNFEIDKMRIMMERYNIDQLYVTSAGKAGNLDKPLELFTGGSFTQPNQDAINKALRTDMKSEGFIFQQDIPFDEEKEKITFITQLNKLILDTIGRYDLPIFNGLTGLEISLQKESIRKRMIDLEENSLKEKLGINKNGFIKSTYIRDLLLPQADTQQQRQSLTVDEATGEFIIPWLFNPFREGLESKLMKSLKKVVQPKMAGKSFVQASAMGITNLDKTGKLPSNIIGTKNYDGSQLKMPRPVIAEIYAERGEEVYLTQEELNKFKLGQSFTRDGIEYKGQMLPAQVLVPFNFFDDNGKLDISNYVDENGKIDDAKLPRHLRRLVGARIPNQSHSSQLPIEIVGFLPTSVGDTIYVPDGITTQMGSDFDVDKLYAYKPNYIVYEDGGLASWDIEDIHSIQDKYFEVMYEVLNNPIMFEKVLQPLDMGDLGQVKNELSKGKVYETYHSVDTQLNDYISNKDAKSGVGTSSLHLTFNSLLQRTNNINLAFQKMVEGELKIIDNFSINIGDISLNSFSGLGLSKFIDKETGEEYTRTTSDNIIQAQSAFVDHAKEKLVDQINLNSDTSSAWFALIQLKERKDNDDPFARRAVNVEIATRMINADIVKDYNNLINEGKDDFATGSKKGLTESVIKKLAKKYEFGEFKIDNLFLRGQFTIDENSIGKDQAETLKMYLILTQIGDELFQTINTFNADTKGAGTSITESANKKNKIDELKATYQYISNREELLGNEEQTEIAKVIDSTIGFASNYLAESFGYKELDDIMRMVAYNKGSTLQLKEQKKIINEYIKWVYSSSSLGQFENPQAVRNRLLYGKNSLAHRLQVMKFKYPNFIFRKLQSNIAKKEDEPSYIRYDTNEKEFDKEQIFSDFFELRKDENPEVKAFIDDLLLYNYVVQGNRNSTTSFSQLIPPALLEHNNYLQLISKGNINSERFIRQYSQHNYRTLQSVDRKKPENQVHIQVQQKELTGIPQFIYIQDKKKQYIYEYWNDQDGTLNYFQIGALGDSIGAEYDFESDYVQSSNPKNIVPKVLNKGLLEQTVLSTSERKRSIESKSLVGTTVGKTLDNIINTEEIQNEQRELALMYREILQKEVIPNELGNANFYDLDLHKTTILPLDNVEQTTEVILHEVAHAFTSRTLYVVQTNPELFSEKVIKAKENLNELRQYVIDKLYTDRHRELAQKMLDSMSLPMNQRYDSNVEWASEYRDIYRTVYGTQNIEEFITLTLTDIEFQKALNGLRDRTGKRSILEQLKDWFTNFLKALELQVGTIRQDSLLRSAVNNAFAVIEEYPNLKELVNKTYEENRESRKNQKKTLEEINRDEINDLFNSTEDFDDMIQMDIQLQQSGRVTYTCRTA